MSIASDSTVRRGKGFELLTIVPCWGTYIRGSEPPYAPVGITHQDFKTPQGGRSEDLAENPPGGLLARGSMPLQYFVDPKKLEGKH